MSRWRFVRCHKHPRRGPAAVPFWPRRHHLGRPVPERPGAQAGHGRRVPYPRRGVGRPGVRGRGAGPVSDGDLGRGVGVLALRVAPGTVHDRFSALSRPTLKNDRQDGQREPLRLPRQRLIRAGFRALWRPPDAASPPHYLARLLSYYVSPRSVPSRDSSRLATVCPSITVPRVVMSPGFSSSLRAEGV